MNNPKNHIAISLLLVILVTSLSSAYFYSPRESFSSSADYRSSFGLSRDSDRNYRYPDFAQSRSLSDIFRASNFDSAGYSRRYEGSLAERTIKINSVVKKEVDDDFFTTDIEDLKTFDMFIKETYRGPIEAEDFSSQNRQTLNRDTTANSRANYTGGFWSTRDKYDADAFEKDSAFSDYYYKPGWNGDYYNWNYCYSEYC